MASPLKGNKGYEQGVCLKEEPEIKKKQTENVLDKPRQINYTVNKGQK